MKRFLKKEWENTEIAPQVLWQTRNLAWQRLQRRRRYRFWPVAAAVASLSALLLVWLSLPPSPVAPFNQSAAVTGRPVQSDDPPAATQAGDPLVSPVPLPQGRQPQPVRTTIEEPAANSAESISQAASNAAVAQLNEAIAGNPAALNSRPVGQDRIVMNFRLPRSGVRMIWISQKTSDSTTGGTGS